MTKKSLLIAIDGPSSSGKGTIAKKIAAYFNLPYLNTGGLYRALAFLADQNNFNLEKDTDSILTLIKKIDLTDLENSALHNEKIGQLASIIAKNQQIRRGLFDLQRNFAVNNLRNNGGAILEGRDIGTIICPDANYKFFITASLEQRTIRRCKQLNINSVNGYEQIFNQLRIRDEQDKNRNNAPLIKGSDAIEIDTSDLNADQVFDMVIAKIEKN